MIGKWRRSRPRNLSEKGLARLSRVFELGLRSGRDFSSILTWISKHDPDFLVKCFAANVLKRAQVDTLDRSLELEGRGSGTPLFKAFIQILRLHSRGTQNLSRLLEKFSRFTETLDELRQKELGATMLPRAQAGVAGLMSLFFLFVLPQLSNGLFRTFFDLQRWDLFASGISVLLLGFYCLLALERRLRRKLIPHQRIILFLYFFSLSIESGQDFLSAWQKSIEFADFDPGVRRFLLKGSLSSDVMDHFLMHSSEVLMRPWPEVLTGILWAKNSGSTLSESLKLLADREAKNLVHAWDDEIRKLSVQVFLPLGFLIFPAVLFLLVGPQLLSWSQP